MKVGGVALEVAEGVLPRYRSRFSRKDFTEPQKVACLIVQRFFRLDYRGIEQLLAEHSELRTSLGLRRAPDHTTLCRALQRLSDREFEALLGETVRRAKRVGARPGCRRQRVVIPDSTGLRSDHASRYYFRRIKKMAEVEHRDRSRRSPHPRADRKPRSAFRPCRVPAAHRSGPTAPEVRCPPCGCWLRLRGEPRLVRAAGHPTHHQGEDQMRSQRPPHHG
jgi:hypothetical protein